MKNSSIKFFVLLFILLSCSTLLAQDTLSKQTLTVGVKITPPFIMKADNSYRGVSIDLWRSLAEQLSLNYNFKEYDLVGLLKALENREIDACINPLTVTSERVRDFDFTQPFYISSLAIAVPKQQRSNLLLFIQNFFTMNFLKAVFLLFVVIFVFGFLLWLVERRHNAEQFAKGWKGIGSGIWWSAVTMTTVGYGDKAPKTFAGRVIATIWMFTAIIIISGFTASIASSLTVNQLSSSIQDVQDLKYHRTGVIEGSSSESFLKDQGIKAEAYQDALSGLKAVADGSLEAFVYDEPIMRYLLFDKNLSAQVQILPNTFNTQYYSFSLPKNSPLLDQMNPVLLEEISSLRWKSRLSEYNLREN